MSTKSLSENELISIFSRFLGYGKLLVTIVHTDSYVINAENFRSLNDQLRVNHVLVQGYGIRQPGELFYEAFPFEVSSPKNRKSPCKNQKAFDKLSENLNLKNVCGYITFLQSGVPDIGCEDFEMEISLQRPKTKKPGKVVPIAPRPSTLTNIPRDISLQDLQSPLDSTEITSFNKNKTVIDGSLSLLKSPDENYFAVSPQNTSPSNVFRSSDCNDLIQHELEKLDESDKKADENVTIPRNMVSQSSIEIELVEDDKSEKEEEEYVGEVNEVFLHVSILFEQNFHP